MKHRWVWLVLVIAIVGGCSQSSAIRDASVAELHAALDRGDTLVLDVRGTTDVFLPAAIRATPEALENKALLIPNERNIYIIGDDARSVVEAANILAKAGYRYLYRVEGGVDEYRRQYPPTK